MKRTVKEVYTGLSATRTAVECAPILEASKVKLKARKSNTEWKTESEDLGTMSIDFSDDISSSRASKQWESNF